jgi:tetratricopeptide (TPR) repeat protein
VISLPRRPPELEDAPVAAWSEPVVIPTYPTPPPDRNPMFLEKRVYQGSSGRVYPNPITDRVSDQPVERAWTAVHLENEYLRLMVLPEIGGRIHVGMDRTNGYDFFYRQNVIKPALVGLLGTWISGGVEFNWPQHHRPSSFMPVDWTIEELPDAGRTVWCSEHEPMGRMKGMHGVTVHPGSSVLEVRVRLFNRTPETRTFLWWANAAARVHDGYQSFFPPDVTSVADHAKRAMSSFPVARGRYYGVDYGARDEPEADLTWYRNIPVPTSFMVVATEGDFFGGYDHVAAAGFVHWADHRISPGKKLWTWGKGDVGYAWDRQLTDADGPYVELMAGVYTDNQPDFSFLAPYETRTFSQHWYPIQQIGPAQAATLDAALSLSVKDGRARLGVAVTSERRSLTLRLRAGDRVLLERTADLAPGQPLVVENVTLPAGVAETDLHVAASVEGRELVCYRPPRPAAVKPPSPAREPALPAAVRSLEELFLIGQHLAQYRHATRQPENYWGEALRRAPDDVRSNTAMGWWHHHRGEFDCATVCFRRAIATLTRLNPNPYDGEPFYGLGLALRSAGQPAEAEEAFAKAAWNQAWRGPAQFARAQLACDSGRFDQAIPLLDEVVEGDTNQVAALILRAAILRRMGKAGLAARGVAVVLALDPLNAGALDLQRRLAPLEEAGASAIHLPADHLPGGVQTALDVAHDYAVAGLLEEAIDVLRHQLPDDDPAGPVHPMLHYTLGWLLGRAGSASSLDEFRRGAEMPVEYCFPARLEEIEILRAAMAADPEDARAPYYLGTLLYDRRRYREAIAAWRQAVRLDPAFPTVHRNLGIAEFNVLGRPDRARAAYRRALRADPFDARLLYEFDQLRRRRGEPPADRARLLRRRRALVDRRDDLTVEYVTLLNELGGHQEALAILGHRQFHPWEGGEGLVAAQWVLANLRLAQHDLEASQPGRAVECLEAALRRPENLGEGKHPLTAENEIHYHLGLAHRAAGDDESARAWMARAATAQDDIRGSLAESAYWRAQALRALDDEDGATALFRELLRSARTRAAEPQRIDYFATSLPTFLVFDDDLDRRNRVECRYLESLALAGLGRVRAAVRGLREVLELDVDHVRAAWHLRALTSGG